MNNSTKTAIIIGGVIIAVLVVVPIVLGAISGWRYGYGMMGPWMMGGFGWEGFMPIIMIVFWGLVIWGIVALVRGLSRGDADSATQADSALEILKKRYARGEITKQEYEERKKDLI